MNSNSILCERFILKPFLISGASITWSQLCSAVNGVQSRHAIVQLRGGSSVVAKDRGVNFICYMLTV